MTKITSAVAAALIASASFASAAFATGDYYEGVDPHVTHQTTATQPSKQAVSYGYTGSVSKGDSAKEIKPLPGSGSYYEGVNRPN